MAAGSVPGREAGIWDIEKLPERHHERGEARKLVASIMVFSWRPDATTGTRGLTRHAAWATTCAAT